MHTILASCGGVINLGMLTAIQKEQILQHELLYRTSRSRGKGGQNVNKVESKVEIDFHVTSSAILTEQQKHLLLQKLGEGNEWIRVRSELYRSQLENKEDARKKLILGINKLLRVEKKRLATKPSKASKRKKLDTKKRRSETKSLRKRIR